MGALADYLNPDTSKYLVRRSFAEKSGVRVDVELLDNAELVT